MEHPQIDKMSPWWQALTKGVPGSGIEARRGRASVDDKRMINCRADVNQLLPLKYQWAWDKYLAAATTTGCPPRYPMQADIALWRPATA
jgi:ribonucleoside-diphosphate reductase beta chain